jgi:hypothetical protein
MKVSYLILAHNNYIHLERLIDQLNDGHCKMYIHINARSPFPTHLLDKPNVHFIKNRIKVYWAGYSMIPAIRNLAEYALKDNYGDYYALISGTDFPVKTSRQLIRQLEEGGEYINLLESHKSKPLSRYVYYRFNGFDRKSIFNPKTIFFHAAELLLRLKGKTPIPFKLYVGSLWFVLTKSCMNYILHTLDTDDTYHNFYKTAIVADESLFQTIIGNSPFLKDVRGNLTYTAWSITGETKLISKKDITLLKDNSTFTGMYGTFTPYFARKFDDSSGAVVALIKETLY